MKDSGFVNDGSIFLPWIDVTKLDRQNLSLNINVHYLANKYPQLIDWKYGSINKSLLPYFEKYKDELDWHGVSQHPEFIDFLLKYPDKINIYGLSNNSSPKAIALFENEAHRQHINQSIRNLSYVLPRINWAAISGYTYWYDLSINPSPESLEILKNNPSKIDYYQLSQNPGIFQPDYKIYMKMSKERTRIYYQELMAKSLAPSRIKKHLDAGMDIDDL